MRQLIRCRRTTSLVRPRAGGEGAEADFRAAQDCFVGLLDSVSPEQASAFEISADGGFDRGVECAFEEVRNGRGWEACVLGMFCKRLLVRRGEVGLKRGCRRQGGLPRWRMEEETDGSRSPTTLVDPPTYVAPHERGARADLSSVNRTATPASSSLPSTAVSKSATTSARATYTTPLSSVRPLPPPRRTPHNPLAQASKPPSSTSSTSPTSPRSGSGTRSGSAVSASCRRLGC